MHWKRGVLVLVSIFWSASVLMTHADDLSRMFLMVDPAPGQGAVELPASDYACWAMRNRDNPFIMFEGQEGQPGYSPLCATVACVYYKARPILLAMSLPVALLLAWTVATMLIRSGRPKSLT